jgi:hypothetical protein
MPCGVLIALFLASSSYHLHFIFFSFHFSGVTILLSLTVFLNMVAETMVRKSNGEDGKMRKLNNVSVFFCFNFTFTAGHFRRCASFR